MTAGPDPDGLAGALFELLSAAGQQSELTVNGWSMRPLIDYGDTVRIQHGGQQLRPGAVFAFRRGNKIVVHRVVRRRRAGDEWLYIGRGDATIRRDPPVRQRAVLGEVRAVRKKGSDAWTDLRGARWRLLGTAMLLRDMMRSVTPLPSLGARRTLDRIVEHLFPQKR